MPDVQIRQQSRKTGQPKMNPTDKIRQYWNDFAVSHEHANRGGPFQFRRFGNSPELADDAFAEGEGDQSLDDWRGVHRNYFNRQCIDPGRHPSETMPVTCEEFKLLHPRPSNE